MLTYVNIDLFSSPAQTLVNTVNVVGVMGKGIAAAFKRLYPQMFLEYRRLCDEGKFDIGMLYVYRTPNKIIVNMPTKKHWRQPSQVAYIDLGLRKFTERYVDYGISSVSFPQLGCGNGELNWEKQVRPLMEKYLGRLPIPVYIHIRPSSGSFIPERLDVDYAREVLTERHRVSASELWADLEAIVEAQGGRSVQPGLFGPSVIIDEQRIVFDPESPAPDVVYREDIEALWDNLRVRGILNESDLSRFLTDQAALGKVLALLLKLEYVRPVRLRARSEKRVSSGLRYVPRASRSDSTMVDLSS